MAVFRREDASCTSLLPAVWPLRMRVNRSAMGSVMHLRSHALLGRALGAADQLLELRALYRVLFHDPGATLLALDHARLRHRLYGSCYFRNGKLNASSNARP